MPSPLFRPSPIEKIAIRKRHKKQRIRDTLAALSFIACVGVLVAGYLGPERIASAFTDARGGLWPGQR